MEECARQADHSSISRDSACAESAENKLSLPQMRRFMFHNVNTIFQGGLIEIARTLVIRMGFIEGARKRPCLDGIQAPPRQGRRRSSDKKLH